MASNLYLRSLSIARNSVARVERQILEATEAGKPTGRLLWAGDMRRSGDEVLTMIEVTLVGDYIKPIF